MTDLERQTELAKELLNTLEQIKATWEELPTEEEIKHRTTEAARLAGCLAEAAENLPSVEELRERVRVAAAGRLP